MPALGQNFDIKLRTAFAGHAVNQADQGSKVGHFGSLFSTAELAVEISKICPAGHWTAAHALDVLADFMLDGFEDAVAVLAFNVELESFFHG